MGARLFKQWLQQPLLEKKEIENRLEIVKELFENRPLRNELIDHLKGLFDLERLLGKIVTGRANARDMINLKQSLELVEPVKKTIDAGIINECADSLGIPTERIDLIRWIN